MVDQIKVDRSAVEGLASRTASTERSRDVDWTFRSMGNTKIEVRKIAQYAWWGAVRHLQFIGGRA
jgi:hypothetical protein